MHTEQFVIRNDTNKTTAGMHAHISDHLTEPEDINVFYRVADLAINRSVAGSY